MKKFRSFLFLLIITVFFCSCSTKEESSATIPADTVPVNTAVSADDAALLELLKEEIRNKTGIEGDMTLEQMVIDVAAIPAYPQNVPDYVQAEAERVARAVASIQNENTISFIALSDLHADSKNQDSILHAAQAAAIIKGKIPIDFTAVLGDFVRGAYDDSYDQHMDNLMTSIRVMSVADPDIILDGNHDTNIYNPEISLSADILHRYTTRFNSPDVTVPETEADRGYFYLDLAEKKIRVICLNSADLKDISPTAPQDGHHVSTAQLNWLIETLNLSGKTDWKIIVLSHHPIHWYGSMTNVLEILDGYVSGGIGSFNDREGTTVFYDFAGKNDAELVLCVNGHTHNFISGKAGNGDICHMSTPNACYGRNNEYGNPNAYPDPQHTEFRQKYGETDTFTKVADSAKDTAFVVYTIDFEKEVIYATCYGSGYDRIMYYSQSQNYRISNRLYNVSTSNQTNFAEPGKAYSTTLTPEEGLQLSKVSVTMDGVDITASVYNSGAINIGAVTGDIVITAAADLPPLVIDIESVGYIENARWGTSDGEIRSNLDGFIAINKIPIQRKAGQTVIVTLSGIDWSHNTNCTLACFKGDEFRNGDYLNEATTNETAQLKGRRVSILENGSVQLEFFDPHNYSYADFDSIRVSGYGSPQDAVITVSYVTSLFQ